MEEFVFDTVNDYYGYMDTYFYSPETPLPQTSGYNVAIWAIYLRNNFGYDIIKRQWEMMRTVRAMIAINNSLFEDASSFTKEFNKFAKWLYFTNYRAIPESYFKEALNYPLIDPTYEILFSPPSQTLDISIKATAHTFTTIFIPDNNDSLVVIISNGNVQSVIENPNRFYDSEYSLYADSSSGNRKLTVNYSSDFIIDDPAFWSVTEILNNIVIREDSVTTEPGGIHKDYGYPSPFYYSRNYLFGANIFIPVDTNLERELDFNVFTSGMELIISRVERVKFLPGNRTGVIWNVRDDAGEKLASGIYIYTIQIGDDLIKGKIAIFN
jgi:hypothetical protein